MDEITISNVVTKPTEGKWFEVNPKTINQKLFKQKRNDVEEQWTRQIILEAFKEVKNNPEKYAKTFETMMPEKTWPARTVFQLINLSSVLGDHMADWVEQALEWAQRIHNGETWESICNEPDTAKYYRLIIWKNGFAKIIGGSSVENCLDSATYLSRNLCHVSTILYHVVPLVVRYKKEVD